MKTFLITFALLVTGTSAGLAEEPKKTSLYQYASLWTDSPFTADPPPVTPPPTKNPLDDFTLTGIAPVPGGYRVTIISKKDPNVKEVISPGEESPFKIISVNRNPGKTLGTTVVLSSGSMQGTVSFEPDLVKVNAPPATAAPNQNARQQPNQPPGANTPNNSKKNAGPRPRIVPPTPQSGGNNNNNRRQRENQRSNRR